MDELETHLFNEVENENMYLKKLKKLLKSYIDFMTNKTEVQRIILRERVNFSRTDQDSWKRVKDRYMSLRERVSNLIEESKNLEVIDSNVDSNDAADLILNGLSSSNDPRSLENIREIIWRGLVKNE
jgi:isocitrate dehydrogenase kinase/phosphatase